MAATQFITPFGFTEVGPSDTIGHHLTTIVSTPDGRLVPAAEVKIFYDCGGNLRVAEIKPLFPVLPEQQSPVDI